jgi:hypothetical protein
MSTDISTHETPSAGICPVHRIGDMPSSVKAVRSKSRLNSSRYLAAAHKDPAGQRIVDEFVDGLTNFTGGEEHRLNQLVRPESLTNFREN